MPTDFRDGKTFPRRGREPLGGYLWLARMFDKARAKAKGTHDGYIYPCPMDRGVMKAWGVAPDAFTKAAKTSNTDDQILAWVQERVPNERVEAGNAWLLDRAHNLDRQDAEEGVPGAASPTLPFSSLSLWIVAMLLGLYVVWALVHGSHLH